MRVHFAGLLYLSFGTLLLFTTSFRYDFRYREVENLTHATRSPLDIDNDDINWIVHVSDLHFSKFRDSRRPTDFEVRFVLITLTKWWLTCENNTSFWSDLTN